MASEIIGDISWYSATHAREKGEPGIQHSFVRSLATALHYVQGDLDPIWLMGVSGFAFRVCIAERLCPSAMSVFDFSSVLPMAVEQCGRYAIHIARYWNDDANEPVKREEAHEAIRRAIGRRTPAVVWDVSDSEWGLIVGYDDREHVYHTLTHNGRPSTMPIDRLGRNGIDILSVLVVGEHNQRSTEEVLRTALRTAVLHAEQKEWTARPQYENGLAAYDLWASIYEKAALIVETGRGGNIDSKFWDHAAYNAAHHYSARCYARCFLERNSGGSDALRKSLDRYTTVCDSLKHVWYTAAVNRDQSAAALRSAAKSIGCARTAEAEAISDIRAYLTGQGS